MSLDILRHRTDPLRGLTLALLAAAVFTGCEAAPARGTPPTQQPLDRSTFAALVERVSEQGGYFDTDNLISNETGYLKVVGALGARGLAGGAYVGVGPDQNYSYIAALRPSLAFVVDVRRDNLLHHLLLKALVERAPTRVEFLSGLHGVRPPADPAAWRARGIDEIVGWVDDAEPAAEDREALAAEIAAAVDGFGLALDASDHATIRRFHDTFIARGLSLRFTTFGRAPRPYYPTYRQLVAETDAGGEPASYLASEESYRVVRELHLANRIVPVVGDLAGPTAVREMARVLDEMGTEVTAIYASNVEFYLWRAGTFERWVDNVAALPASEGAVVIRSYFPNGGGRHPSAIGGYYAVQSLQPLATLVAGGFTSYWDVVTRDVLPLR